MSVNDAPFIGSEALSTGLIRKHQLRSHYRALYPGIYLPRDIQKPTFRQRVEAAFLWARREAVIAGLTAARLHSAKWIGDELPIELVWRNTRAPAGVRAYALQLGAAETGVVAGLPVTTPARTAFDIGRRGPLGEAVARLDALGAATGVPAATVLALAERHPGARGLRQLKHALSLHDSGAQSPRETWLRLLVIEAGFPKPRTQISVGRYYLDMGWEDVKVAAEYDGDQHRTDRVQFAWDITRLEELADLGWLVVRVAANNRPADVVRRLRRAWERRAGPSRMH